MKPRLDDDVERLLDGLVALGDRWLVWGPSGVGKTTLTACLADALARRDVQAVGIAADPGSPGFGVPGAVAQGLRCAGDWRVERLEALCTLDAVRYRLPLVLGLGRLAGEIDAGALLIDAPGVVRGPAAAELLGALVETVRADAVLAILPADAAERAAAETLLRTLTVPVVRHSASPLARRRSKHQRAIARTALWDAWLAGAEVSRLALAALRSPGEPSAPTDWTGRQLALLDARGRTTAFGEVRQRLNDSIDVRLRRVDPVEAVPAGYLLRDARRDPDGLLTTERRRQSGAGGAAIPPELASPAAAGADPACFAHLGVASALLVNGVFGDPLLHIRLRQQRRSLLFDLGDSARLPAKIAHQVTDVFITHAHMDHIGGFLWFLRSRIGVSGLCRLYGPPGLADHISAFVAGIRWDRIADRGPRFEVRELAGDRLRLFRLQVGLERLELQSEAVEDGTLLAGPRFRVRAITLDHGIPVLAFALEVAPGLHIRKERLADAGLSDGPWLGELKRRLLAGEEGALLRLPDGRVESVSALARQFMATEPEQRLVYATDLADKPDNRARLVRLARAADVLICEAAFTTADAEQAGRTGHLTARACGEIGASAKVRRLIPFHFSRRYESDPDQVYGEVSAALGRPLGSSDGDAASSEAP